MRVGPDGTSPRVEAAVPAGRRLSTLNTYPDPQALG